MLEIDWAIGAKTSDYISHNSPRLWANLLARLVNSLLFRCKREIENSLFSGDNAIFDSGISVNRAGL